MQITLQRLRRPILNDSGASRQIGNSRAKRPASFQLQPAEALRIVTGAEYGAAGMISVNYHHVHGNQLFNSTDRLGSQP